MKKVSIMALVLMMFIFPLSSTHAYDGGFLNGKTMNIGTTQSTVAGGTTQLATDNDEATFYEVDSANEWVWLDLPQAKRITGYKVKTDVGSKFTLYLFREDGTQQAVILSSTLKVDGTLTNIDVNDVKKIGIRNNEVSIKQKLYEVDVFGVDADIDLIKGINSIRGSTVGDVVNSSTLPNDGDLGNSYPVGGGTTSNLMWWKLPTPVDIDVYRVKMDASTNVSMVFYAPDKTVLRTVKPFANNFERTAIEVVENVGYVALVNNGTSGVYVYEVDFYGEKTPFDGSVTGLTETYSDVSATLSWLNPDLPSFTGTKIKQNGVEVATLANTTNSYNINGLTPNTAYTFEVIATHSDNTTSIPKSVTFTTLDVPPDLTAPSNISNINYVVTDAVASFMYALPVDTDFSHLKIYRDGVLMDGNFTGTSYDDFSLVQNTTYVYKFISVDLSGNESNGYTQSVTTAVTVDNVAPSAPIGFDVTSGNASGYIKWTTSSEADVKGYNLYIDGVKHNTSLILANTYVIPNLVNNQNYSITITAVDTSDNESVPSDALVLTPTSEGMPFFEAKYDLQDVADGTSQWFSSMWLILAFSVGIPIAFFVARKVKGLLLV